MKTLRFFGAALMAVTLSFGMTSCGSDDDDNGIVLDPTIKATIADVVEKYPAVELGKLVSVLPDGAFTVSIKDAKAAITKIVVDDTKAIVYKSETKAVVDGENVFVCQYKLEGDKIVISCPELEANITVSMDDAADILINDDPFKAELAKAPAAATPNEVSICRTWKNPGYTAGVWFDKLPIYGVQAAEQKEVKEIKVLAKSVMDKLIAKDSKLYDDGFKILSSDIESVTFLTNNVVYVVYTNGKVEESTWKWTNQANGELSTVIDGKDVALTARFQKGTPNKAYFVITANMEGVGGLGVHTLTGRLVCNLND